MKPFYAIGKISSLMLAGIFSALAFFPPATGMGQSCPSVKQVSISTYPNTYYPGTQAVVSASSKSITVGASVYGTTPIGAGDALLIIQMQGSQIDTSNNGNYGQYVLGLGQGYLSNASMVAGNMEYIIADSALPLTGGTLRLRTGLKNSYQTSPYGKYGQYTYQIIRVPFYNDLKLTANIAPPAWNGSSGGVLVLIANDSLIFNGNTINATAAGFRGGGGLKLTGNNTGSRKDYETYSNIVLANGSKGEGISGTPRYVNIGGLATNTGVEGYPGGSFAQGAPGNAGGGGTDGDPNINDYNTGGGGAGNGGAGGIGGNAWNSNNPSGGRSGVAFASASPSRFVMGGGGGAGTSNDGTGTNTGGGSAGSASGGGAGGGIIILSASYFSTGVVISNGVTANSTILNDGAGGGGAGGTILITNMQGASMSNVTVIANGGNGGSNQVGVSGGAKHGPGGGGGGGIIYANSTLNAASSVMNGANGLTGNNTSAYGAAAGSAGVNTQNISLTQINAFPIVCWVLAGHFVAVSAENVDNGVTVTWEFQNGSAVKEYQVEKSMDGMAFNQAGVVNGDPSATMTRAYSFQDHAALAPGTLVYYRVAALNESGDLTYSSTVAIKISGTALSGKLSVSPNPVQASPSTISFTSAAASQVILRLFSINGAIVWQKSLQANAGVNYVFLDNTSSLANGIYILQSMNGAKTENIKVLVNH